MKNVKMPKVKIKVFTNRKEATEWFGSAGEGRSCFNLSLRVGEKDSYATEEIRNKNISEYNDIGHIGGTINGKKFLCLDDSEMDFDKNSEFSRLEYSIAANVLAAYLWTK